MTAFDNIRNQLAELDSRGMYRRRRRVESPQTRQVTVDGRRLVNFCSNDYLGLAADPRVRDAFKAGIDKWGVGAGGSHLVCGHTAAHEELEECLAAFTRRPRALLYSNGYAANLGVINALLSTGDRVFEDRLNHASLLDGGWISRADFNWYGHCDLIDLQAQLAFCNGLDGRTLIVSDGTFSMDGDVCPLPALAALALEHDAWLMIDEAHSFGVRGNKGAGLVEPDEFTTVDVPVLMATLGKALGTFGAFVAGDEALIELLIQRSRNYIFTTALPAAIAVATLTSLRIVQEEAWRRDHLQKLVQRFRDGGSRIGLELLPSDSPIQPVIIGDPGRAVNMSAALERRGLLIPAIRPPTVPEGTSRLRITFTAAHTAADVDHLLEALEEIAADQHRVET
jgi:8-amino-7-oxononanoate synthase